MKLKYIKLIYILLLLTFFSSFLSAKTVDSSTSKTVAKNYFALKGQAILPTKEFDVVIENKFNQNTTYYIYGFNDSGFVIVSGDDSTIPILGYSLNSQINESEIPPALQDLLNHYSEQIDYAIESKTENIENLQLWNSLLDFGNNSADNRDINFYISSPTDVSPLISTQWDQGYPYNALCPDGTPVGCVAVAMAQIMKYWNHPISGTGSNSYTHPTYGTLSANFGETTYNWSNMPNSIYSSNNAVATLMYHCGVSINMQYGPGSSGASVSLPQYAFKNYFGYASLAEWISQWMTAYKDIWNNVLRSELDANRPILLSGYNSEGGNGHSFVCDGYQGNDYFHFNWGWGGYADGYYYLDDLTPALNFSYSQNAVVGIKPAPPDVVIINPTISTNINNEVIINWDINTEQWVDYYRINRNPGDHYTPLANVTNGESSYTDTNLISGQTYYYTIEACDIDGVACGISEELSIRIWSPPTSNSFTVTVEEDGNYNFKSSDFSFSDADGHSFAGITITQPSVTNINTIKYNQSNLSVGTTISDINNLHFTPSPNDFGQTYVKFNYKVMDSSGDIEDIEKSVTINVTPINDLPSAFTLQTPTDNYNVVITKTNLLNNHCEFKWTISEDYDGDQIFYNFIGGGSLEFLSTQGLTVPEIKFDHTFIYENIETESIVSGTWTVEATDGIGITQIENGVMNFVIDATQMVADKFALDQNFPNPFNPVTYISYGLKSDSDVLIDIYNLTGQHIVTLVDELQEKGTKVVQWQGADKFGRQVDSGIYFYKLQAGDFVQTKKMILLK